MKFKSATTKHTLIVRTFTWTGSLASGGYAIDEYAPKVTQGFCHFQLNQVWFHSIQWFSRKRSKCEEQTTNNGKRSHDQKTVISLKFCILWNLNEMWGICLLDSTWTTKINKRYTCFVLIIISFCACMLFSHVYIVFIHTVPFATRVTMLGHTSFIV